MYIELGKEEKYEKSCLGSSYFHNYDLSYKSIIQ